MILGQQIGKQVAFLTILAQIFLSGGVAFAQTTTDEASPAQSDLVVEVPPKTDQATVPDTIPLPPDAVEEDTDLQGASSTPQLQETFSDQESVDPSDTSADDAVELATTTDEILPPAEEDGGDVGTTTDEVPPPSDEEIIPEEEIIPTEEDPAPTEEENIVEVVPTEEVPLPVVENIDPPQPSQAQSQAPITISREELRPMPMYTFSINTQKRTATTRKVRQSRVERGRTVVSEVTEVSSTPPSIAVDNGSGVMRVSGSCNDRYYVILIYNNETDYDTNKNLYVVNRAFPCEGGSYSYDLVNLPPTLPDGKYYLLVGEMGEGTPWQPITSLTEIELHRNH